MAVIPAPSNYFDNQARFEGPDTRDDSTLFRERKCCCGLLHIQSGFLGICLIEVLLLANSLIFVFITIAEGNQRYQSTSPEFAKVIKIEYLYFVAIVQFMWLLTNFLCIVALKTVRPLLLMPNFGVRIIAVTSGLALSVVFFVRILQNDSTDWFLMLFLSLYFGFSLVASYFCVLLWACYKYLKEMQIVAQVKSMWLAGKPRPKKTNQKKDSSSLATKLEFDVVKPD